MSVAMNLHGGTWEEYDAVARPEITADDGSCRWKWLNYGDTMLAFHEPTVPRPTLTVELAAEEPAPAAPCATCGRREGEHYSFSLHEGEDPILVCAPGQYIQRWQPAPEAGEHVERGGDLLVAAALPRGCNRHDDCHAADERWLSAHLAELHVPSSYHCRDECCEDCFGA